MNPKKLASALHPLERKALPCLTSDMTLPVLAKSAGITDSEASRALQWLAKKELITLTTTTQHLIALDTNGKIYAKNRLPEQRFLIALDGKELTLTEAERKSGIEHDEVNICLGVLQRKGAILISKDRTLKVKATEKGINLTKIPCPEETFLKRTFPLDAAELTPDERSLAQVLRQRRRILKITEEKVLRASITDTGKEVLAMGLTSDAIEKLTPDLLKTGGWKHKEFRRYDLTVPAGEGPCGRLQPYRQFLQAVREKFLRLGFTECEGPTVEQEFWNMDALYMPQFHAARDIHDAYFIKEPTHTQLPKDLIKRVKAAHENGGGTGSRGWQYAFDEERTQRNVLRSQDTAISPRTLASPQLKIPGKYFQIVRCFRHDVIDATHLPDFDQAGGFIIGEDLTLRHLFGLLKMFAREVGGCQEFKLVPGYFPFTEPSCELIAKHPTLGWVELAGAGMFRPEMVKPLLGREVPVIAWGFGIGRLAMFSLGIKDIRQLYSHDLAYLRKAPAVF